MTRTLLLAVLLLAPVARATPLTYFIEANANVSVEYFDPDHGTTVSTQRVDWTGSGRAEYDEDARILTFDAASNPTPITNLASPAELEQYSWLWSWSEELHRFHAGRSIPVYLVPRPLYGARADITVGTLDIGNRSIPVIATFNWAVDCSQGLDDCVSDGGVDWVMAVGSDVEGIPMLEVKGHTDYTLWASTPEPSALLLMLLVVGAMLWRERLAALDPRA